MLSKSEQGNGHLHETRSPEKGNHTVYPFVITGSTSPISQKLAERLEDSNCAVAYCTRIPQVHERFNNGGNSFSVLIDFEKMPVMEQAGVIQLADSSYPKLNILNTSAAGVDLKRREARPIVELINRMSKMDTITDFQAMLYRGLIRSILSTPDFRQKAMLVNYEGPAEMILELIATNKIDSNVVVATISSIYSNKQRLDRQKDPMSDTGMALYENVADSKIKLIEFLERQANSMGIHFVDFVLPKTRDTKVGDLFLNHIDDIVKKVNPGKEHLIDLSISLEAAGKGVAEFLMKPFSQWKSNIQRVYITENGYQLDMPEGWDEDIVYPL